jgi:hypothetical protein
MDLKEILSLELTTIEGKARIGVKSLILTIDQRMCNHSDT